MSENQHCIKVDEWKDAPTGPNHIVRIHCALVKASKDLAYFDDVNEARQYAQKKATELNVEFEMEGPKGA